MIVEERTEELPALTDHGSEEQSNRARWALLLLFLLDGLTLRDLGCLDSLVSGQISSLDRPT